MSYPLTSVLVMPAIYDVDPSTLSPDERISAGPRGGAGHCARIQARQLLLTAAIVADPCAGSVAPDLDKEW
jgi:hypothetical protein